MFGTGMLNNNKKGMYVLRNHCYCVRVRVCVCVVCVCTRHYIMDMSGYGPLVAHTHTHTHSELNVEIWTYRITVQQCHPYTKLWNPQLFHYTHTHTHTHTHKCYTLTVYCPNLFFFNDAATLHGPVMGLMQSSRCPVLKQHRYLLAVLLILCFWVCVCVCVCVFV